MKKKLGLLISMIAITTLGTWAQGAKSIRLTEVMTDNRTSIIDEYGKHKPWVELSNTSFTTYNVRGMFLTTDRRVLNPNITPEQRRTMMVALPNNEPRTTLGGKKSLVIYDHSWAPMFAGKPAGEQSPFQLNLFLKPGQPNWVALYDGNAVDLIDSVSLPPLLPDQSWTLSSNMKNWSVCDNATPGYLPQSTGLSKPQIIKETDPHGFGIAVLAMGIVFACLALLFIFFWAFGSYMRHKQRIANATKAHAALLYHTGVKTVEITSELSHKTNVMLKDGLETKGIDKETYMAVISLALQDYLENKHDIESGVITIKPKETRWNKRNF